MVVLLKSDKNGEKTTSRHKIVASMLIGAGCFLATLLIKVTDPVNLIVRYNLRLDKDTLIYNLMQVETKAAKLHIFLFNITNAEQFMSGEDSKIKLEEVGPFVYQEYRWFEDLKMSEDGTTLEMTPRIKVEFILEESIGHPKKIKLSLPNLPLLGATSILSNYPYLVRFSYNMIAQQSGSQAIITMDAHTYLWGYDDPLVTLMNGVAPGLVHFKKLGLLDRMYNNGSEFRMTVGATHLDRFSVKSVKQLTHLQIGNVNDTEENEVSFNHTYEGFAFPPNLTPELPISIYRVGICRTFELQYLGSKPMEYGGEAFVYTISNSTFAPEHNINPVTGLPFIVSKGHFLDADPKLMDRIEGLRPDKNVHLNEFIVDKKVGITYNASMSMQLNIMLNDISYNAQAQLFSNMVVPFIHIKVIPPEMLPVIQSKFDLVFKTAPRIVFTILILLNIIGLTLIIYDIRSMYHNFVKKE